jgi:hypothetical protein
MPKLLVFAPCERVIIGQGDNTVSLITLIEKLELKFIPGTADSKIDENAGFAARLSLFTQWQQVAADEGKTFEQKLTFGQSGKKPDLEAMMQFEMTQRIHRLVVTVEALPYLHSGEYEFCLWMHEKGDSSWPDAPIARYPIEVGIMSNALAQT